MDEKEEDDGILCPKSQRPVILGTTWPPVLDKRETETRTSLRHKDNSACDVSFLRGSHFDAHKKKRRVVGAKIIPLLLIKLGIYYVPVATCSNVAWFVTL